MGCRVWARDLLGEGPTVRHDPARLASALLELAAARGPRLREPA
jgi:hypothetical protein